MTLTGVAVAVVAISRFVASQDPALASYLASYLTKALQGAEAAGIAPADLEVLQIVIKAVSLA